MEKINILSEYRDKSGEEISNNTVSNFQDFMINGNGELAVLDFVNAMCIESLEPLIFEKWEEVKKQLINNRKKLKNDL